ncbi:metallophosphoesterase family protein [Paenibacillus physcomitrellae]|uniref:Serine/threonine protein phosphatase n=1 Tax=Paenibacillus physcomitrellae TaxID=1619311 RepID=A0ABQ1FTS6_9BACL|nr:metallophosphoesterase family protein [Paenibacillus physcomitrellae]GGA27616.1 serine/threonine protein phosphatase [Paenibacillus physcomitrellae]
MEKIAVISDIHGNLSALKAVLKDIEERGIKRIFCLGDLVGKGPHGDLAVDLIKEKCEIVVSGNWDEFIREPSDIDIVTWNQDILGQERMAYLESLPFCIEFMMSGRLVRLFHASPRSLYERIYPWDEMEKRESLFEPSANCRVQKPADVAGYGDIHTAFLQHLENGRTLFNAGSVGNSLDMIQASYVIMEGVYGAHDAAAFGLQFVRVPYDVEEAIREAEERDMPQLEPYAIELRTGQYRGKFKA